jgi:hypothetical protein
MIIDQLAIEKQPRPWFVVPGHTRRGSSVGHQTALREVADEPPVATAPNTHA